MRSASSERVKFSTYIVFAVLRLVIRGADLPAPMLACVIVFLLAVTSAISVAVHLWFEKPVMTYLREKLG